MIRASWKDRTEELCEGSGGTPRMLVFMPRMLLTVMGSWGLRECTLLLVLLQAECPGKRILPRSAIAK